MNEHQTRSDGVCDDDVCAAIRAGSSRIGVDVLFHCALPAVMADHEHPACSAAEVLDRACAVAGLVTISTIERDHPNASPTERSTLERAYEYLRGVYRSRPPTGVRLSPRS